jgi:hypothetical protein
MAGILGTVMRQYVNTVPVDRLNELLTYDPASGLLRWKIARNGRVKAGALAGMNKRGYVAVRIDLVEFGAHRLAWAMHYGVWPKADIDHMNGDRSDNRIVNLRDVTRSVNAQNQRRAGAANKTGYLGVYELKGRFIASIKASKRTIHLGAFATPEEASAAYIKAKRRLHEGCQI